MEYNPVCGSDGLKYPNLCALKSSACMRNKTVAVVKNGSCGMFKTINAVVTLPT